MNIKHFHKAASLDDAYERVNKSRHHAIIAGGAWMKFSSRELEEAIDLSDLGLDAIEETKNEVIIGSMTTLHAIETSEILQALFNGILPEAAAQIVGVGLRNVLTIGGSIIGKYGFSDLLGPLLCMDAQLNFHQAGKMSLEAFLDAKSSINDVLVSVHIPKQNGKGYFKKVRKTALDFAVLNIAITKTTDQFKIALGSRPARAILAMDAMAVLNGYESLDNKQIENAAKIAADATTFGDNHRASKAYRKELAYVYVRRGLFMLNKEAS